jgi:single-strand DNA-binding protein
LKGAIVAATNINRVILTGNLTRDPELRTTGTGLNICSLRIAVNTRRKDGQSGQWVDEPNYFDITVFGAQGENCSRFLSKGRPVAIDGRLKWREWTDQNTQQKRQAVEVIADSVQFLGGGGENGGGGGGNYQSFAPPSSDVPADASDFQPAGAATGANGHTSAPAEDDIPF